MISSCSENSQHPWRSHFNIDFSWQYNFSGKTTFKIVSYFSAHYQTNGLFSIKINAIQNQWISSNVIGHPQGRRIFLLYLFVVVSSLSIYFKLAYYSLLLVAPFFTSFDVTEGFDLQIYFKWTSTKEYKCHYNTGQLFWITKWGKVVLKSSPVGIRRPVEVQWTSIWSPDIM